MFYRVADSRFEGTWTTIDTDLAESSPRMKHSAYMTPVFNILLRFWGKSGVNLVSACNSMLLLSEYLEDVQKIEKDGGTMIPTSLFSANEPVKEIPLITMKGMLFPYVDLYEKTGLELFFGDLEFFWEYLWSVVRNSFYPEKISRFSSVFLFDNREQAEEFKMRYHNEDETSVLKVDLIETRRHERYDAGWLDVVPTDGTLDECFQCARKYWEGEFTDNPNPEYLFSGQYRLSKE